MCFVIFLGQEDLEAPFSRPPNGLILKWHLFPNQSFTPLMGRTEQDEEHMKEGLDGYYCVCSLSFSDVALSCMVAVMI